MAFFFASSFWSVSYLGSLFILGFLLVVLCEVVLVNFWFFSYCLGNFVWVVFGFLCFWLLFVIVCVLWATLCCSKHDLVTVLAPPQGGAVTQKRHSWFLFDKRPFAMRLGFLPKHNKHRCFRLF